MAESIDLSTSYGAEGLLSLGGIPHRAGKVTPLRKLNLTATATATIDVLEANPARLWARITNNDDSWPIIVYLGETWGSWEEVVMPHGSLQIDKDCPFTGRVRVDTTGTSVVVIAHEMSVQP